jgi:hypothetical protein
VPAGGDVQEGRRTATAAATAASSTSIASSWGPSRARSRPG